jgi:hypothetical protein
MKYKHRKSDQRAEPNYEVGFRKPPKAHRFQKGQSGNPKGRPKGMRSFGSLLYDVLNEKVPVRQGEQMIMMSGAQAMLRAMFIKALKGDSKAFQMMLQNAQQYGQFHDEEPMVTAIEVTFVDPPPRPKE